MWPEKGEYADTLHESLLLAQLTGRYLGQRGLNQKRAAHFQDELEIPTAFNKAIEFFFNKNILTPKQFEALSKDLRRQAFSVAKLERDTVIEAVHDSLQRALELGETVEKWKEELSLVFDLAGVSKLNNHYLDNIFRTNLQEAFNRGKDAIFDEADIDEFPLMQFHTMEDSRVRTQHDKLNKFTAPKDDPIWQRLRPPLSWHCRCTRTLVHKDEGLEPTPESQYPSTTGPGFEFVS